MVVVIVVVIRFYSNGKYVHWLLILTDCGQIHSINQIVVIVGVVTSEAAERCVRCRLPDRRLRCMVRTRIITLHLVIR